MAATANLDQVTLCWDGTLELKWMKVETDDETGAVLFRQPHRMAVGAAGDLDASLTAAAQALLDLGFVVDAERDKSLASATMSVGPLSSPKERAGKRLVAKRLTLCADGSIGVQLARQRLHPINGSVVDDEPLPTSPIDFDANVETAASEITKSLHPVDAKNLRTAVRRINAVGRSDSAIEGMRREKSAAKASAQAARGVSE